MGRSIFYDYSESQWFSFSAYDTVFYEYREPLPTEQACTGIVGSQGTLMG